MTRVVHFDIIPMPTPGEHTFIVLACGLALDYRYDISTDPDDITCPDCLSSIAMIPWRKSGRMRRAVHLDVEPPATDGPPWTAPVRLACGRPYLDQLGLEADAREATHDLDAVTCPDCGWIVRRERESNVLPPHYWRRYPVGVDELARALRNVCRPHWQVDLRLGAYGMLVCEAHDADRLVAHYHAALVAEGVIQATS